MRSAARPAGLRSALTAGGFALPAGWLEERIPKDALRAGGHLAFALGSAVDLGALLVHAAPSACPASNARALSSVVLAACLTAAAGWSEAWVTGTSSELSTGPEQNCHAAPPTGFAADARRHAPTNRLPRAARRPAQPLAPGYAAPQPRSAAARRRWKLSAWNPARSGATAGWTCPPRLATHRLWNEQHGLSVDLSSAAGFPNAARRPTRADRCASQPRAPGRQPARC